MISKKIILLISLLPTILLAQTPNSWSMPSLYPLGIKILEKEGIQNIEEDDDNSILFMFASKNQIDKKSSDLWITKCFKSSEKGILITSCLIQYPLHQDLKILVNSNSSVVILSPIKSRIGEINYKIDNEKIISSNEMYLLNKNFQVKLLSNILRGKKLSYSYKLNNLYKTNEVDLDGLAKNYYFSLAFIKNN